MLYVVECIPSLPVYVFLKYLSCQSDGVDVEEDSDKVTLIRSPGRQDAQKQSFIVSDEVAHIEERARKMESLEVKLNFQSIL